MDWKSLIADLQARGYTQSQIATHCDCGQATISEMAKGKHANPSFRLGKLLLDLHAATAGAPNAKAGEGAHA